MATRSIRGDVKRYMVERMRTSYAETPALVGVPVSYGFADRDIERDHAWCVGIFGTVTPAGLRGDRQRRDDAFSVAWLFMASDPNAGPAELEQRVLDLYAPLDDLLATDWRLGGMDGLQQVEFGEVDGPSTDTTDEGPVAFISATVDVQATLL